MKIICDIHKCEMKCESKIKCIDTNGKTLDKKYLYRCPECEANMRDEIIESDLKIRENYLKICSPCNGTGKIEHGVFGGMRCHYCGGKGLTE